MKFRSYIRRSGKVLRYYIKGLVAGFASEPVFVWCAAIAFKVLIALFPLVMLIVGVFGLLVSQETVFLTIDEFVRSLTPEYVLDQSTFAGVWRAFADLGGTVTVISAVSLFVTVISLLATLRVVIGKVFSRHHEERSILGGYLFDLRMTLQGGLFFLLTLILIVLFTSNEFLTFFNLREGSWLIQGAFFVLPFAITVTLFVQLYYFIPRPRPMWHSAVVGALTAGILWELAKFGFTLYASRSTTFELYARVQFQQSGSIEDAGRAVLGDFISMTLVLLFWVYYSGFVIVIGAMVAALCNRRVMERRDLDASELAADMEVLLPEPALEAPAPVEPAMDSGPEDSEAGPSKPKRPAGAPRPPSVPDAVVAEPESTEG